jgi:hypothetical protein
MNNIRRGFNQKVNNKIDYILSLCKEYGLEFNNLVPNEYTVISKMDKYVFTTYNDTINALELLQELKEKKDGIL